MRTGAIEPVLGRRGEESAYSFADVEFSSSTCSRFRNGLIAQSAAFLSLMLGAACLAGWWLNIQILRCIVPGSIPLKPNIGAGFLLCGFSLALLSSRKLSRSARIFAIVAAVLVAILAALTLVEYFFNRDLGIDYLLARSFPISMGVNPGRMMPTTAFCFLLFAGALLVESRLIPGRLRVPLVAGASAFVLTIGVIALGGFALEKIFGPQWNLLGMNVSGISAAVGFMILGSGLLALAQSEGGLIWSLDGLTTAGFAIGILLTILTTASAFTFARQMLETNKRVTHRQDVLKEVQRCMTGMAELAASERVYAIVGDASLLKQREQTTTTVWQDLRDVRKLISDNPNQQGHLDGLERLIRQRIDWEEKVIAARRQQGSATAGQMIATGPGLSLSDEIAGVFRQIEDEEYGLLATDRKRAEAASTATFLVLPLGVFLSLAVLSLGVFFLNAGVGGRVRAEQALRQSEQQYRELFKNNPNPMWIYDCETLSFLAVNAAAVRHYGYSEEEFRAMTLKEIRPAEDIPALIDDIALRNPGRSSSWRHRKKDGSIIDVEITSHELSWLGHRAKLVLSSDITARLQAEREVLKLNVELEERVRRRTAELEAANKELEAFSYSVSHDLRAPLRAVDGFSQAVMEDYGPQLPEEGRHYLRTIRDGAQRMGELIDDLLTFSRLSRLPLNRQQINSSNLVGHALAELKGQRNGRKVDIRMGDLPPCYGDPALLKQVWINLLSNAFKYTRKRDAAVVEVGSRAENGETVYFVSDNGTGFDMQYMHKLFGVFQRLHRADEFEGTGVGLAIVQRVVHRHGGRVWAEATPDRGAAFYFTIDRETNS